MPINESSQIARFLEPHRGHDPVRYARLRTGKARRTAESVWRRDLHETDDCARLAVEVVERHAATGARDKSWLEIVEKGGRFPIVDTFALGVPPEGADDEDSDDNMGKGEIISALVTAVLGANRQITDESISLRQALATKDEQMMGLVQRHTELAMTAAKDGVLLRLHEEGIFNAPNPSDTIMDRVQALLPIIEKVSPHIAAAYAAHRGQSVPVGSVSADPEQRVDACLVEFEAIAADPDLALRVMEPVRFARVQAAAARIMSHAKT